jgi:porphobilinogen synthase
MLTSVRLNPKELVYPIFVDQTAQTPIPIPAMPGVSRLPLAAGTDEVRAAMEQVREGSLLFGVPAKKDEVARARMPPTASYSQA